MPNNTGSLLKNNGSGQRITCANDYFRRLGQVLQNVPDQSADQIAGVLLRAYEEERRIFLFGNGGSAALASHFACDLAKGTTAGMSNGKRFRAIALTDNVAVMTAWANDSSYDDIFAEPLKTLLEPGDIVFAISASGNSRNVLKALEAAREGGGFCVGITGFKGGKMKSLCDLCLVVPSDNMQLIEDVHLTVAHALYSTIRHRLESEASQTMATAMTVGHSGTS
jgi:D-sedoheptulose 7-phosphate isomerase